MKMKMNMIKLLIIIPAFVLICCSHETQKSDTEQNLKNENLAGTIDECGSDVYSHFLTLTI